MTVYVYIDHDHGDVLVFKSKKDALKEKAAHDEDWADEYVEIVTTEVR